MRDCVCVCVNRDVFRSEVGYTSNTPFEFYQLQWRTDTTMHEHTLLRNMYTICLHSLLMLTLYRTLAHAYDPWELFDISRDFAVVSFASMSVNFAEWAHDDKIQILWMKAEENGWVEGKLPNLKCTRISHCFSSCMVHAWLIYSYICTFQMWNEIRIPLISFGRMWIVCMLTNRLTLLVCSALVRDMWVYSTFH